MQDIKAKNSKHKDSITKTISKQKQPAWLKARTANRVRQGNFTPTSSQNRAWNSRFTRLFSNVGYPVRDACLLLQVMALVEPGGWWNEIFPARRRVVTESSALSLLPAPSLHLPFSKHPHYYEPVWLPDATWIIGLMVIPPCCFSPAASGSPLLHGNACVALRPPLLRLPCGQHRLTTATLIGTPL
jgi:hypothetical protein